MCLRNLLIILFVEFVFAIELGSRSLSWKWRFVLEKVCDGSFRMADGRLTAISADMIIPNWHDSS